MGPDLPLSRAFAAGAAARDWRPSATLEALLRDLHDQGLRAWPAVVLSAEDFAAHLGGVTSAPDGPGAPEERLRSCHAADLYLARACAAHDPVALAAFDAQLLGPVGRYVAHLDPSRAFADHVRQLCRVRMLLGTDGSSPTIADYSGRGPLQRWVRVSALRMALNERQRPDDRQARAPDPEQLWARLPGGESPEETYLRRHYQAEFRKALADAFLALTPEQRKVLSLYVVDRMGTPELGRLFGVNTTTVWRWLERARALLTGEMRRSLRRQLGLGDRELDSLLRLVDSSFDGSLPRLLREGTAGGKQDKRGTSE